MCVYMCICIDTLNSNKFYLLSTVLGLCMTQKRITLFP
jgi:hypothetical protein